MSVNRKYVHDSFPEPKEKSPNVSVLFDQPKKIQFSVIEDEEKQKNTHLRSCNQRIFANLAW